MTAATGSRTRWWSALLAVPLVVFAGACGSSTSAAKPATEAKAVAHRRASFVAKDLAFTGPRTLPAGVYDVRLRNDGPEYHSLDLVHLDDPAMTNDEFVGAFAAQKTAGLSAIGGPNAVPVGKSATVTVRLDPGVYVVMCPIPGADGLPHVMKGMLSRLRVTGTGTVPKPTATVTVELQEYGFAGDVAALGRADLVAVHNRGGAFHELTIVPMPPGTTREQFDAWAMGQGDPNAFTTDGGVAPLGPGATAWLDLRAHPLAKGRYLIACFIPTTDDQQPHMAKGMIREINVE